MSRCTPAKKDFVTQSQAENCQLQAKKSPNPSPFRAHISEHGLSAAGLCVLLIIGEAGPVPPWMQVQTGRDEPSTVGGLACTGAMALAWCSRGLCAAKAALTHDASSSHQDLAAPLPASEVDLQEAKPCWESKALTAGALGSRHAGPHSLREPDELCSSVGHILTGTWQRFLHLQET